ncbi:MAG: YigZ family protein [Raineya sp.]|jgi:uncharacterized YigZ family protein|nr:YigZ family protein [Raineya sp.]
MTDIYYSIETSTEGVYKEKGSKFLAFAYPVETEEDIKNALNTLKKEYFDATHHCYAYILGANQEKWRANDDGEPNHSAGTPILNQIKAKGVSDVLVVVVRYYGGTKLGVSGLIQAYKISASLALEEAKLIEKVLTVQMEITYNYSETSEVMNIINKLDLKIISQNFDLFCHATLSCKKSMLSQVQEALGNWIKT